MKHLFFKISISLVIILSALMLQSQPLPDVYKKGTINEQLNQLEAHTKIYENFRAIREDVFQTIQGNVKDTLAANNIKMNTLRFEITILKQRIDSFSQGLETTKSSLQDMTKRQNSISVLGLYINKSAYNTVMWSLLGIAVILLIVGYFIFKKNMDRTIKARTELSSLEKEFEDYKQKKRIEIETMTMNHFTEMKKLKESYNK